MERIIHKYFDQMESLEERLSNDVEDIVSKIDIKAIIANPLVELTAVVSIIKEKLEEEYQLEAFEVGQKFARDIQ